MPTTVRDGFETLIRWIKPTETETYAAASHRRSVEACLKNAFGLDAFFRAGSFGHGTSVSRYSDIDYFAVLPTDSLRANSALTLRDLREVLEARFPRTGVYVDSPAVVVPFGQDRGQHHEIIPADLVGIRNGVRVYDIPDWAGGWMRSAPLGLNAYTDVQNDRLGKKAKQLVRLVKLWNYANNCGLRSVYVELRVSQYLAREDMVAYPADMWGALNHLRAKALAPMSDPLRLGADIEACRSTLEPAALSKLNTALSRIHKALAADAAGAPALAFYWWDKVLAGWFPRFDG